MRCSQVLGVIPLEHREQPHSLPGPSGDIAGRCFEQLTGKQALLALEDRKRTACILDQISVHAPRSPATAQKCDERSSFGRRVHPASVSSPGDELVYGMGLGAVVETACSTGSVTGVVLSVALAWVIVSS